MINYKREYDQVVDLDNDESIFPSKGSQIGVTSDDHLTFSSHVDKMVLFGNSKFETIYIWTLFNTLSYTAIKKQ